AGGKSDIAYGSVAADLNRADDRAVGIDAAGAVRALKTAVGEEIAGNEALGFLGVQFDGDTRGGIQNACTDNGQTRQLPRHAPTPLYDRPDALPFTYHVMCRSCPQFVDKV